MTFRWSILAFAAILVLSAAAAVALLVLLDPRSQAWWGDRFSDLGTFVRGLVNAFRPR